MYNYLTTPYCAFMRCPYMAPRIPCYQNIAYKPTTQLSEEPKSPKTGTGEDTNEITNEVLNKESTADLKSSSLEYEDAMPQDHENIDNILKRIEKEDPMLLNTLTSYGIPYSTAVDLVRRIVPLTSSHNTY